MKKTALISIIHFLLFLAPIRALAHGTEEEHASEATLSYWSYGLIISLSLLVIFLGLFIASKVRMNKINPKKKENRSKYQSLSKKGLIYKWTSVLTAVSAVFFLVMANVNGAEANEEENVTFKHIHGLGYTSNGEELYVPAHDGLRIYKEGSWSLPEEGEKHDYMGFSMVEEGFYSSGHPAPGSDLANPLGIVKSTDGGKTIDILDLYKEIDFHGMTVGYKTEDIYVFNPEENSRMNQPGFYYSTDGTESWNQSQLLGLEGQAVALAAHPTEEGTVAIGTDKGVFLSNDYGNNFEKLPGSEVVSAISFGHQNNLLAATQANPDKVVEIDLSNNKAKELSIPDLKDDTITYVQQNPADEEEYVFATGERDIYFSHDGGKTWEVSVEDGESVTH